VLPFTNLSGDLNQEYFSNGISDQLINTLSRIPGLFVIARNSSFAYKGKATQEHEIGKELGVKYLLEGSVHKAVDRVRIGVELVDASTGAEMWAQRYDRPLKDIFAVQDEIVGKVVTTLGLFIKLEEMKAPHATFRPTDNLEAYDDFLRGVAYYLRFTRDDNEKAKQWTEKAIELDPSFGEAYALLGWIHLVAAWSQWSQDPVGDLARSSKLAQTALALDDSDSDALALLSDGDWMQARFDQAVANAERAVAINPNYAEGFLALSNALAVDGKSEEALRAAEKAMRLDPARQDFYGYAVGNAYIGMERNQEAIQVLKRTIGAYPNLLVAHLSLTAAYVELGRDQEARAEAAEILRISPHYAVESQPRVKDEAWWKRFVNDLHKAGLK
jgi:adenylate cyclase